ncbi:MAG: ATP-dependent DNA helicase RecG [Spirochaetales bacterium]|jgi:ATP-dependent DNA helicase RecG|nr:ATP-dependent DNA helicase RecG [Spirochaetales bacterium]
MYLPELLTPVWRVKGTGGKTGKTAERLGNLGIFAVRDILMHLPRDYDDRTRHIPFAAAAGNGGKFNTTAYVQGHDSFYARGRQTLKLILKDESALAEVPLYGWDPSSNASKYSPGTRLDIAGTLSVSYGGKFQCAKADMEAAGTHPELFSRVLPVYNLTAGIAQKTMRRIIRSAYGEFGSHLEDEIPAAVREAEGIPGLSAALKAVHEPVSMQEAAAGRRALAFRELFLMQMAVARRALQRKAAVRPGRTYPRGMQEKLIKSLPFRLTQDQAACMEELRGDIEADHPMARLLQGDVGSGKTLVAFLAALLFTEAGRQTAIMAPTELLARQHADNAARFLQPLGVRLAFFSGALSGKTRKPALEALKAGDIDIVIGTHALFSDDVEFRDLGFVIIDEQHRFGVVQRNRLFAKGLYPDILVMSATPIPQTLALSAFGDMDVSTIKTMPAGRKPVETHLALEGRERKVYDFVRGELERGRQAYFVYPIIEEAEAREKDAPTTGLKDAESMYRRLKEEIYPGFSVGLIHSRLAEDEKRDIMAKFSSGEIRVLAATSVVEVGVDVANASCMVIEHAERFGLAALHQLRGRVGRGSLQSYAFLVYAPDYTEVAKKRLTIMKETTDGFRIAEEDLLLRGPGDLTGIRQAGLLDFSAARLPFDQELMMRARAAVHGILEKDPGLLAPQHSCLRDAPGKAPNAGDLRV